MMKRFGLLPLFLLSAGLLFGAQIDLPNSLSATLEDSVSVLDVVISLDNEDGMKQDGNITTLEFDFPVDKDEWEISRSVGFTYTSNLLVGKVGVLSFNLTPLHYDEDNVVDTSLKLETENQNVSIVDGSFHIAFAKGYQGDIPLGTLIITAKKPASQKLAAGEYAGSISVNLYSSN
jgi:hypothetical protein